MLDLRRRQFITLLAGSAAASAIAAVPRNLSAQGVAKSVRIGWLTAQREASLTPFSCCFAGSLCRPGLC
jgi:hypothetical protein